MLNDKWWCKMALYTYFTKSWAKYKHKTQPKNNYHLNNAPSHLRHIVISAIFILLTNTKSTYQENIFCPKACTCDEQTLETLCKGLVGASGLPHTLNPNTKRLIINKSQTNQLSGLDIFTNLESLDLAHNKLSLIDFMECKTSNLISLNTSHNNITDLRDTLVSSTLAEQGSTSSALNEANDLVENNLRIVKKLAKINLVELILSYNQLQTLRNLTFIRLHKLQRLDLSFNYISSIEAHSLFGLNKLEMINLRSNRLTQVPTLALHNTIQSVLSPSYSISPRSSSLKYLDLSENTLTSIGPDSFSLLEKAQEIYLESCSIQSIHEQAFKGLHTLYLLSLDKNNLQEVPSKSFNYLGLLRLLKMSANNFTSLEPESFSALVNLEELQLNNGSFSGLKQGVFNGLDMLRRLDIAYNPNLTKIDQGTFENLSKLTYLSLYSNSLASLPDDGFNDKSHSLSILDLRGNLLNCACDLKWLTKWLKKFNETAQSVQQQANSVSHSHSTQHQNEDTQLLLMDSLLTNELLNLTCSGPPALFGKPVVELPENKLECLKPSSDLNVNIGFAMLFFITFIMTFVCLVNFCRNKKHLFVMLKENLVQNHISMMLPYSQNLHKNVDDLKKETELYGTDYEPIDYRQHTQVYNVHGDEIIYCGPQQYSQHI